MRSGGIPIQIEQRFQIKTKSCILFGDWTGPVSNSSALLRRSNKKSYSADNFKVAPLEKLESTDLRPHPKQPGGSSLETVGTFCCSASDFLKNPSLKKIEKTWNPSFGHFL
jgi:hypothetical protein